MRRENRWRAADYWIVPRRSVSQYHDHVGVAHSAGVAVYDGWFSPDGARDLAAEILAAADEAERRASE